MDREFLLPCVLTELRVRDSTNSFPTHLRFPCPKRAGSFYLGPSAGLIPAADHPVPNCCASQIYVKQALRLSVIHSQLANGRLLTYNIIKRINQEVWPFVYGRILTSLLRPKRKVQVDHMKQCYLSLVENPYPRIESYTTLVKYQHVAITSSD